MGIHRLSHGHAHVAHFAHAQPFDTAQRPGRPDAGRVDKVSFESRTGDIGLGVFEENRQVYQYGSKWLFSSSIEEQDGAERV